MKQVYELTDAFQELKNNGILQKTLRDKYHLTDYGAQKFVNLLATEEEVVDGRGTKKYGTDKELADYSRETRHETIPVTTNYSTEIREPQHEKASTTQEARSVIEQVERAVKTAETEPVEWSGDKQATRGGVDTVWHLTDTHIGALVENEHGETVYTTEDAQEKIRDALSRFYSYTKARNDKRGVDTVHLLLGGDIVEGTGIYQGQSHEIDSYINEQIEKAGATITEIVTSLASIAEDIEADLQIVCVPGNHGDMRVKGASNEASFDDIIYHMLNIGLNQYLENHEEMQGNIRLKRSDRSAGMSFPIRGHTAYLTHGEDLKQHVGTSSGIKDALSIVNEYGADLIFRGHYHMPKVEDVHGTPVIMSNSFKPGGSFEDSIRAYGETGTNFYTVSDDLGLAEARWIQP